jgi:hypothetical protein
LVAADAVAAVLRTMAADSANIVLIDIFRLLVRSGVVAALLSTQTPAASDHSINHEGARPRRAADAARARRRGNRVKMPVLLQCMSPLLAQSGHAERSDVCPLSGVKRTWPRDEALSAVDPKRTLGWTEGEYLPIVERANFTVEIFDADAVEVSDADTP